MSRLRADPAARAAHERAVVGAHLGTTGRFELVPFRDALGAGAGSTGVVGAAALLFGPWMSALVPPTVGADVARATGGSFGPAALGLVVGGAVGVAGLAALLRRPVGRRRIAVVSSGVAAAVVLLVGISRQPVPGATTVAGALLVLSHGAVLSLVCDLYHPFVRVRALGPALAGGIAGAAAVPLAVALGGGAGLSWRGSCVVLAVLAAIAAAVGARLPDAPPGARDEVLAHADLRAEAGEAVGSEADERLPTAQALRRILAPPSVRPLLLLATAGGLLLGPLGEALRLVQRDRWVVVVTARPLLVGAVLVLVAASLALGRRLEVAWRAAPARLLHQVAWGMTAGGVALGVGAVLPHPLLALVPLGAGAAACGYALLGAAASASRVVPAALRPLALGCTGLSLGLGAMLGVLVLGTFGSRFGPAWGALSLAGLLLALAATGVRAIGPLATDAGAAVDRLLDAERLASARRRGLHVPLLECRGIDFSYGQLQVLFDVSFRVDDGEMVALLGTNGAGKSTLLRVISGLGLPSRGSVALAGRDITFLPSDARVSEGITQVPGGKAVFGSLSVADNLRAYGYSLGRDTGRIDAGIEETFATFPRLAERRNQLAATLSGGEQQMLALGKALILEPRLLLIDELSLGLAPKIVGELLGMVERINRTGTAIVLVEQSVNIALSLVDHAYFMEKGQVRFDGRAAELLERPDLLRSVFLAEAGASR